jgi:hypothetical protein
MCFRKRLFLPPPLLPLARWFPFGAGGGSLTGGLRFFFILELQCCWQVVFVKTLLAWVYLSGDDLCFKPAQSSKECCAPLFRALGVIGFQLGHFLCVIIRVGYLESAAASSTV